MDLWNKKICGGEKKNALWLKIKNKTRSLRKIKSAH
jgi:hypothetical protein